MRRCYTCQRKGIWQEYTDTLTSKWVMIFHDWNYSADSLDHFPSLLYILHKTVLWFYRGGWRKLLDNLYSSPSIIPLIKSRKLRWTGHVARIGEKRNTYKISVWKRGGNRLLGRNRCRWEKMGVRKGKVVPALNQVPLNDYLHRSGRTDPRVLNIGTRRSWVVSFTHRPLYPRGELPVIMW